MSVRFTSNVNTAKSELRDRKRQALNAAGLTISGTAKTLTPVETGRLRSSITHAIISDSRVDVGTNVEYAVYVHEILDAYHPVGEAKFIEKAMAREARRVEDLVRRALTTGLATQ